jgi:NAD(P)-dependent dehydrogenase (short-subunit alcohol dehydrogenase family)
MEAPEAAARFGGQVILITGGTGALGSAVARAFLQEGANVAVTYRSLEEYEALQNAVPVARGRLQGYQTDVTDEAAMLRLVASIREGSQRLDVLVNTVGGYAGGARLWEVESAVLERMLALNLRSAFVAARSVLPIMLEQGRGCIVSIAARAAVDQPGGSGAYVASKAAALALMHSLAMDLKGTAIRVNSLLPSTIDTAANRRAMPRANFAAWTKTDDIARVILFMCSQDASAINGASIPV